MQEAGPPAPRVSCRIRLSPGEEAEGQGEGPSCPAAVPLGAEGIELVGRTGEASEQRAGGSGPQREASEGLPCLALNKVQPKVSTKRHQNQTPADNPLSRCTYFRNEKHKTSYFFKVWWSVCRLRTSPWSSCSQSCISSSSTSTQRLGSSDLPAGNRWHWQDSFPAAVWPVPMGPGTAVLPSPCSEALLPASSGWLGVGWHKHAGGGRSPASLTAAGGFEAGGGGRLCRAALKPVIGHIRSYSTYSLRPHEWAGASPTRTSGPPPLLKSFYSSFLL